MNGSKSRPSRGSLMGDNPLRRSKPGIDVARVYVGRSTELASSAASVGGTLVLWASRWTMRISWRFGRFDPFDRGGLDRVPTAHDGIWSDRSLDRIMNQAAIARTAPPRMSTDCHWRRQLTVSETRLIGVTCIAFRRHWAILFDLIVPVPRRAATHGDTCALKAGEAQGSS